MISCRWLQIKDVSSALIGTKLFTVPKFGPFNRISNNEFQVNVSYAGGAFHVLYKFFIKNDEYVAFDLLSTSFIGDRETFGDIIGVTQEYLLRMEHSGAVPMGCSRASLLTKLYNDCESDVLVSKLVRNAASYSPIPHRPFSHLYACCRLHFWTLEISLCSIKIPE
jgi:hypothetical protein